MNTQTPILAELNRRKSVRIFSSKEIEPEKIAALWEAARWAPSSANKQEWRYYAVMGTSREKLRDVLKPGNHWALNAPLILGVARDGSIENATETREYGMYDVALSVMCLVIEAEHQGLRAHQIAGFYNEPFRRIFRIAPTEIPVVMVAIGYEEEGLLDQLDPSVREKELRPRVRKALSDVVSVL